MYIFLEGVPRSFPTTSYISASRVARHQKSLGEWLIAPTIPSSSPLSLSLSLVTSIISDKNNNNIVIKKILWNIRNKVWEISGTFKKWGRWPWATKNVSPLTATALEPLYKVKTVENHLIPISYISSCNYPYLVNFSPTVSYSLLSDFSFICF